MLPLKIMIRRALIIVAVLFASISLLTVVVIPHHHHSSLICFHAHPDHHDEGCVHDEENEDSGRSGLCILKINYLLRQASEIHKSHFQDRNDKFVGLNYQLIPSESQADIPLSNRKLILCIHSALSRSFEHLSSSGLRAPPVI